MIILGIDPGFSFTGFAIIKKEHHKSYLLDCGYLSLPASKHLSQRIGLFHEFFCKKITQHAITDISLETPFLGKNAQNFLKLGYLRGILYLLANTYNLQLHEFAPREVKLNVTGFGGASKEQVARVIYQLFPQLAQASKHDITDAIAITLCGLWNQRSLAHTYQALVRS